MLREKHHFARANQMRASRSEFESTPQGACVQIVGFYLMDGKFRRSGETLALIRSFKLVSDCRTAINNQDTQRFNEQQLARMPSCQADHARILTVPWAAPSISSAKQSR